MKYLTYDQFRTAAKNISEQVPFELELKPQPDGSMWGYVPYIMNDAMECYLVLENCRIIGEILPRFDDQTYVEFADHTMGISVRQGENIYTAWFTAVQQHFTLYRYHEIGHFWTDGEEQWRRMVYMIGTIYDKVKFSPEPACTPEEEALAPLMEFCPFRVYSPVHESILALYPETGDGAKAFAALAAEAGDKGLTRMVRLYDRFPNPVLAIIIANRLMKAKSAPVYQLLWEKLSAASGQYPARDYGEETNAKHQAERNKVTAALLEHGFTGTYPLFRKPGMEVYAAEEQPFTILENEGNHFNIQFMVSEYPEHRKPLSFNYGFFHKATHRGYIYRHEKADPASH